jgi:hypothetical protein
MARREISEHCSFYGVMMRRKLTKDISAHMRNKPKAIDFSGRHPRSPSSGKLPANNLAAFFSLFR